ncbi:MAG TPA: potassium channel family protein [Solirubrobacteraceae bacterium]
MPVQRIPAPDGLPDATVRGTLRLLLMGIRVRRFRYVMVATSTLVVLFGVLMRLLNHSEFPNVWIALWWSLQTATTVGYGDVVPHDPVGRILGALVMIIGVAFLSLVTAAIASTFVVTDPEAERRGEEVADTLRRIEERLDELARRRDGT